MIGGTAAAGAGSSGDAVPLVSPVVADGLVDILSVHDAEGRYVAVSPSIEVVSGHAPDDLVGASPFDLGLVHADDVDAVVADQLAALADRRRGLRTVYRFRRRDGAFVWVESAGRVVLTLEGLRFVLVTREAAHLDSLHQGMAAERRLQAQLDELVERQRQFLTTISHRARTPLTVVHGLVETLDRLHDQLGPEDRATMLARIRANTTELVDVLATATDADRLARDDIVLERRVVELRGAVADAIGAVAAADGPVQNLVPAELTAVVDRIRVVRMLTLLLGNAVVHGGHGVRIWVRARQVEDGVELVVEDDGPGVPPERRAAIFRPFVHGIEDAADPGAGLGLYVVAELAARHGGRVAVDERPGGGARFTVWLPRLRGDTAPLPRRRPDSEAAGGALPRPTRVLVERLLRGARARLGLDIAYLSVFDDTHQHVLAVSGQEVAGIRAGVRVDLDDSYCTRMIAEEVPHAVPDTRAEADLADLPATRAGLRCWVGVPVRLPDGHVIASLCAAGATPMAGLSPSAADALEAVADVVGELLADVGFVAGSVLDAAGRVAEVLTSDDVLHVVVQPIVALASGTVTSVEALSRFRGHDRPVDLWFGDAARMGLDIDLEVRALRLALRRLADIDDELRVAVNVSPRTLCSDELAHALGAAPLDRISLELAEHASVADYGPLRAALTPWRREGLHVAVDDVGTGFAGIGHLVQLSPDVVKVDRSIVATLAGDAVHRAAVDGLARLVESLGAAFVAEGVEDAATLRLVRELGFTHVQGYVLGRPHRVLDRHGVEQRARELLGLDG